MSNDTLYTLKREATAEPFEFTVDGHDGKIRIPHLSEVDQFELARLLSEANTNLDFIVDFLRLFMDAEDFAAVQEARLSRPMLNDLWSAYQKFCGVEPGE